MKTQTKIVKYESPELRFSTLELDRAFLSLSGFQVQVDESISTGYDGTEETSGYYIDFN